MKVCDDLINLEQFSSKDTSKSFDTTCKSANFPVREEIRELVVIRDCECDLISDRDREEENSAILCVLAQKLNSN